MTKNLNRLNDIPVAEHFRLREFECPCCHCVRLSPALLACLVELRRTWEKPILITSGYRCSAHNKRVKGAPRSLHMAGQAADVAVPLNEQAVVEILARRAGMNMIIPYGRRNFMHLAVA